ncbi:MAG: hypothetical protein HFI76_11995 [Lachnospiraceae bacterium]|jgi:hypothetical protein|nr:hypothetical protein [Lachnospiraceae bacterium]
MNKIGKKLKGAIALSAAAITLISAIPVHAANTSDTRLPSFFISYDLSATTELRAKEDKSAHYVNNTGAKIRVRSLTVGGANLTLNGYGDVPAGEKRRVRNTIKESGFNNCKLSITTPDPGTSIRLFGWWSPDCAGNYKYAEHQ